MTDMAVGVRITGDASGLVGQLKAGSAELKNFGNSAKGAAPSVEQLERETRQLSAETRKLASETRAIESETRRYNRELASLGRQSSAFRKEQDAATSGSRASQYALRNLGFQASDFAVQLAGGTSAWRAFVMQGPQAAGALADFGGKAGAVGRFLTGPWGVALSVGAIALGTLAGEADDAGLSLQALGDDSSTVASRVRSSLATLGNAFDPFIAGANRAYAAAQRVSGVRPATWQELADRAGGQIIGVAGKVDGAFNWLNRQMGRPEASMLVRDITSSYRADQAAQMNERIARQRGEVGKWFNDVMGLGSGVREPTTSGGRARGGGGSSVSSSARDASAALKALEGDLSDVQRQFDPAATAAANLATQLEKIARLKKAGRITADQAADYGDAARLAAFDAAGSEAAQGEAFVRRLEARYPEIARRLAEPVELGIADAGDTVAKAFGFAGDEFGQRAGDGLKLSADQAATALAAAFQGRIGSLVNIVPGAAKGYADFGATLTKGLDRVFGANGSFGQLFGQVLGGAQFGNAVGRGVTSVLGVKGSNTGGAVGGGAGALAGMIVGGPVGAAIGSVIGGTLGSVFGGLLKKTPNGATVVTGTTASSLSSSGKLGSATAQSGSAVQQGVKAIAEALGGTLGSFSVAIGKRGDEFRVSESGNAYWASKKKTGSDIIYKGNDEGEATRVAIMNAVADGGVQGLTNAVRQALSSSTDLDEALAEALKVREVEDLLGGLGTTLQKQFKAFEAQAKERVRIATAYGFDVVAIEKKNADDRAKLLQDTITGRVGSLQALLKDIRLGNLFEGSAVDQRRALIAEIAGVKGDADAGKDGAADKLADLERQLLDLTREAFGTAGGEYASDRAGAIAAAEAVIKAETDRANAAAKAAQDTNKLLDEGNDLAATANARLDAIYAAIVAGGGVAGSSAGGGGLVNRQVEL